MRGTLSMIGLYNWDNTLFDNIVLPETLERDIFIATTLEICADCEVIYPDFDFLKEMLGFFSKHRFYTWNELQKTLMYDYNPISNYDRKTNFTDIEITTGTGNSAGATNTITNSNSSNISAVTSFNSGDFKDASKNVGESGVETNESGESGIETKSNRAFVHTENTHGNIGVTTSQELIEAQRKIVDFDIYQYIAKDIKNNFCILVY